MASPFHLAIPVSNLETCRTFYRDILGCEEGRNSDHWVDFNFFGHQLVIHYKPASLEELHTNSVDGKAVPVPHFGVVLPWEEFESFSNKLKSGVQPQSQSIFDVPLNENKGASKIDISELILTFKISLFLIP